MTSKEFEKIYNKLNKAQKKAVDTIEGAVMVIAGPGTGKTQVLTLRIANILLKTQVNPENILALTFTDAAALEMRKRLISIIGHDAYRVEITTFHAFCNNFIKVHQEEFADIIASVSINEVEQLKIIETCITSLPLITLRPLGDGRYYLKPVLNAINELKRESITPALLKEALSSFEKKLNTTADLYHEKGAHKGKIKSVYQKQYKDLEKNKELLMVFEEYQKNVFVNKKYDYNDMLLEVIKKLIDHPYLLQLLQEKFHYFLVDEHQDTNAAQNKIIELLCNYFENPNLFVVGDEKQAIFRFQGATLENFLYFKKLYPEAQLINLSENYRSTKTILDATHSVILNNPKSTQIITDSQGLIKKSIHKEEKIEVAQLSSPELEYFWVVQKINDLLKSKLTIEREIAVLARNNKDLDPFVSVLERFSIPYIVESDRNVLDDIDVQKLILLFRVALESIKNHDEYVKKALLLDCFNIQALDVFKLIRESYDRKISVWDLLKDNKLIDKLSIKGKKEISIFVNFFTDQNEGLIKKSANQRFDKVFVDCLNQSNLMNKILEKPHAQEILSKIVRLYDEVRKEIEKSPSFSLADFLSYINFLEENELSLKQNTRIIPDNAVRLMTVHKSKGLEFDCVFIINAFDGHWGNSRKRGSAFRIPWEQLGLSLNKDLEDEQNVDERRLFYVALTRARKYIFLSYSLISQDGREQIPSQFINEIPKEFIRNNNVEKFEEALIKHQERMLTTSTNTENNKSSFLSSKEYISQLFKRQGLSVSALNNYLKCPWMYFFNNLIRVPEVIDNAGLFGNAMHYTLNRYIRAFKKRKVTQDFLIKIFKQELQRQPITKSDMPAFYERGEKALEGYYRERVIGWNKDIESEIEIRGIRIDEDIVLNGKIDMIEPVNKNIVDVYDFKTGGYKSRNEIEGLTKNSNGNYKRQLVFYRILLDRFKNGFYQMRNGIVEFIEPDEKGIFKHEAFSITKEETDQLLLQIKEIGEQIMSLSFWDTTCDDNKCKYCLLRAYIG